MCGVTLNATVVDAIALSSAWFVLNIGVTLQNKSFFAWFGFNFPITLSLVHMLFSLGGSYLMLLNRQFDYQKLTVQEQIPVALFSVLFCANIVVGNAALRYVAVSLVQVVRSIIPGLTLILSMVVLGKSFESIYYGVVTLIVVGVALASYGEVEFHVFGFLLTLLVCFLSSLKSVTSQRFLVGKLKFHPFDLLLRMSWMAAVQMALLSLVFEREGILTWWAQRHAAPTDDDDGTSLASGNGMLFFALSLTLNGSLAFFLNYTNFMTTKKTSALTVTVAGNVKHMATIIVSVMLFRNPISAMNAVGTLVTCIGAAIYSALEYQKDMATKSALAKTPTSKSTA